MSELPCSVVGAENLPAEIGGAEAVCSQIRAAVGSIGGKAGVLVRVNSPYAAAATVTRDDGQAVPEIGVSISDRSLNQRTIQMLAEQIALKIRARQ